jgi:nitroimidazol reductase NimA-like FMN-containing flavoprotein (pyridoxamine 5'-phosphate oxidase superfamily)
MPMPVMSDAERDAFLAERRVGLLGVAREGKGPLLAPIWFHYEPSAGLRMYLSESSAKGRRLAATGRATLAVHAEDFPYRYVIAEGPVTLRRLGEQTYAAIREMASRYLGADAGERYAGQFTAEDEVEVLLVPQRWQAVIPGGPADRAPSARQPAEPH